MRFIQTYTYLFRYQDWFPRVGLGMLFSLIPIVGPIALHGWFIRLMRVRISGDETTLPALEFGDFGALLRDGGVPFLVNIVLALPMMLAVYFMMGVGFAIFLAGVALGSVLQESMGDAGVVVGMGIGGAGALLVFILLMVMSLALAGAMHVFILRAEVSGRFGVAFDFGAAKENLRGMFKPMLVGNVVVALLTAVAMVVLYFIPFIGIFFAIYLMMAATSELRTMVYREYLENGGTPIGSFAVPMADENTGWTP
jgi:hypothetical protein